MKKTLSFILAAIMMLSVFSVTINAADVAGAVVTSAKVSGNGILVKWSPVKGAVSYILYRLNSADGSEEAIANISANQYADKDVKFTSVNDNNATANIYKYAVAVVMADNSVSEYSFNGANNTCEAYCQCESMKTVTKPASVYEKGFSYKVCNICGYETKKVYTAQLAPKTPVISALKITASGVYVKWNLVDGAKEYIVYRKVKGGSWAVIDRVKTTTYVDKTAKSGVTYQYTVKATNGVKASAYKASSPITFVAMPDDFKIGNAAGAVVLNWEKIAGATSYRVYRKVVGDEEYTLIGKGSAYKTTNAAGKAVTRIRYIDESAEAGVDYIYTVKAAIGSFRSAHVNTAKEGYNQIRRLEAPELTKIENSKDGVTIYWSKVEGAKGYYVYRKTADGWVRVGTVNNARSTAYLVRDDQANGVSNGKNNIYTVKAIAGKSASAYDKTGIKILRIQEPDLKAIKSMKNGVYVKWDAVAGAKGYYVYSKTAGKGWKRIATVSGQNAYTDKTAKKGVTYTYTVKAFNGKTVSSYDKAGLTVKDVY